MSWLAEAAKDVDELIGVVVAQLPEASVYDSWSREQWPVADVAAYFGDMSRSAQNALQIVDSTGGDLMITLETDDRLIVVRNLRDVFVGVFIFPHSTRLAIARRGLRQLCKVMVEQLPTDVAVERSRAERIMAFLLRYAPDPHTIPMRVSLQTGIDFGRLGDPSTLDDAETELLEEAAKHLLGLEELRI